MVQESLKRFRDNKFFSGLKLFEGVTPEDKKMMAEADKEAQAVVKRAHDNWNEFRKTAQDKDLRKTLLKYDKFLQNQKASLEQMVQKDPRIKKVYNLYESDFLVALYNDEGQPGLMVIKKKLEKDESNPFFISKSKTAVDQFLEFMETMKRDMLEVKKIFKNTVEKEQKEKEQKEKKEKLDKFLKEKKAAPAPKKEAPVEESSEDEARFQK